MDHNEVCDILNLAAGVTEEIDFDEDLDEVVELSSIQEIINTLETALYKLSFIVHHNNYCCILVKTFFSLYGQIFSSFLDSTEID